MSGSQKHIDEHDASKPDEDVSFSSHLEGKTLDDLAAEVRTFETSKNAKTSTPKASVALKALLDIEQQARNAANEEELYKLMSNEARKVMGFRQSLILVYSASRNQMIVKSVTSFPQVDRSAPMIQWVERMVKNVLKETHGKQLIDFILPAFCRGDEEIVASYPFANVMFSPLMDRYGEIIGCQVSLRDAIWTEADRKVAERLSGTFSHALSALQGPQATKKSFSMWRIAKWVVPALIIAAGFIPVPLSTLAPVEVMPRNANIVAAPSDGIVLSVEVEPNAKVEKGDVLVRLNDTDLANQLAVAKRNVEVAQARSKSSNQAAFFSAEAKRELASTRAELEVARAEQAAIAAQLARSIIKAPEDGVVLFRSKRELIGRPVAVGDRLMRIADPKMAEFRIELPVSDAIMIERQSQVRVFLDTDPLNAINAELDSSSYHASPTSEGVLAYALQASPEDKNQILRVGARGTAKLIGDDVPLYFFLFRKPIATMRQWIGF